MLTDFSRNLILFGCKFNLKLIVPKNTSMHELAIFLRLLTKLLNYKKRLLYLIIILSIPVVHPTHFFAIYHFTITLPVFSSFCWLAAMYYLSKIYV